MRTPKIAVVFALVAVHLACVGRPGLQLLQEMPVMAEAVVAPDDGRLFPSAVGPGDQLLISEEDFALSVALAEIRASVEGSGGEYMATIAAGDHVEVLVAGEGPQSLCLVRTKSETYCWLSRGVLKCNARQCTKRARD